MQFLGKFLNLVNDLLETLLTVIDKIHLIYSKYKVTDSHQCTDSCMSSGLYEHALLCIHKDNGKVCKGCTDCHVSCVLLMSRSICHDKASLFGCKVTVCHINSDTLFTLCHQSVQKEGVIDCAAAASYFGIQLQRFLLICVKQFGII